MLKVHTFQQLSRSYVGEWGVNHYAGLKLLTHFRLSKLGSTYMQVDLWPVNVSPKVIT